MLYKGLKYLRTDHIYSFEAEMKYWYETFNLHFPPQAFYCLMFENFRALFRLGKYMQKFQCIDCWNM
jgi:hypothetical protein